MRGEERELKEIVGGICLPGTGSTPWYPPWSLQLCMYPLHSLWFKILDRDEGPGRGARDGPGAISSGGSDDDDGVLALIWGDAG
jgi:hypothetical protein